MPARATLYALVLLLGAACNKQGPPPTTVPTAWRNPEFSGVPFTSFFIIGVARNDEYRRLYEDHMARALAGQGALVRASWTVFPESEKLDRAQVLVAVDEAGYDAVVIARLKDVKEQPVYVPARPATSSDEYMGGYDEKYAVNSDPAHYRKQTTYRIETSVYSVRDELLAWVALSDTVDPQTVEDVIHSVTSNLAKRMKAEGLIKDPP